MKITDLLKRLQFNPNTLLEAAVEQPELYVEAAKYRGSCMEARSQIKLELDIARADLEAKYRESMAETGERVTERLADNHLANSKHVQSLQQKLIKAEHAEEMAKSLMEAFRMRRDSIRIAVELRNAELTTDGLARKIAEENAALLKEARGKR